MWEEKNKNNTFIYSKIKIDDFIFSGTKLDERSFCAIKSVLKLLNVNNFKAVRYLLQKYRNVFTIMCNIVEPQISSVDFTTIVTLIRNSKYVCCQKYAYNALQDFKKYYQNKFRYPKRQDSYIVDDLQKIVFCSSYRRLKDKAQVYSLNKGDYVRCRLTHSNEVSVIAESIVRKIDFGYFYTGNSRSGKRNLNYQNDAELVCRCAGLLHDFGNPPFGHYAEDIIGRFFKKRLVSNTKIDKTLIDDLCIFDGNAQAFRIITKLQKYGTFDSLFLSASVLGSIIKYPFPSSKHKHNKFGYYLVDSGTVEDLKHLGTYIPNIRNPFAIILEAADDISYHISDLEDAIHKNLLTPYDFENEFEKEDEKLSKSFYNEVKNCFDVDKEAFEQNMKEVFCKLKNRVVEDVSNTFVNQKLAILNGVKWKFSILDYTQHKTLFSHLKDMMKKYIYNSKPITEAELKAENILGFLLNVFCNSVENISFNKKGFDYSKSNKYEVNVFNLITDTFKNNCLREINDVNSISSLSGYEDYCKYRMVIDFISGMTDSYAYDLYNILAK